MTTICADGTVEAALEILRDLGLAGEVYAEDGSRVKVAVAGGRVESLEERRDRGIGIRVFLDGRVGFSHTAALEAEALRETVSLARDIARHAGRDEAWHLPEPEAVATLPFPNDDAAGSLVTMPKRVEIARAVEAAAFAADRRIEKTRQAVVIDYHGEVRVAHTGGLSAGYRFSRAVAYVDVVATENGASQLGHHAEFGLGVGDLDAEAIGSEAAAKAVAKLGARSASTGRVKAVLDREVVAGLLDALSPAFSARRVLKGTSLLAGRKGERLTSRAVSLVDDPTLPGGYGSAPADGEGLTTRRIPLLEDGRLVGFLHDTYSSTKMAEGRPGNSVRSSYLGPPQIGPMNLLLLPGDEPRASLLERAESGVLITEVMGLHTVDPVSGDFSLGGAGRLIESGKPGAPVEQLAFSGNLLELLTGVEAVGSDLKLFPGGGGAPSVLLGELSVAGAS